MFERENNHVDGLMWLNKIPFFTIVNSNQLPQSIDAQYLIIQKVSDRLYIHKRGSFYRKCNVIQILEPNKGSYSMASPYHFQGIARGRMEENFRRKYKSSFISNLNTT